MKWEFSAVLTKMHAPSSSSCIHLHKLSDNMAMYPAIGNKLARLIHATWLIAVHHVTAKRRDKSNNARIHPNRFRKTKTVVYFSKCHVVHVIICKFIWKSGVLIFVYQSWMGRDIFLVHCHGHSDMRNHTLKGAAGSTCQGHDHGSKRKTIAVYEGQWPWSNHSITTIHTRLAGSGTCLLPRFPKSSNKQCLPWSRVCALLYIEAALATNR